MSRLTCFQVVIGMDVAASEFYTESDNSYDLNFKEEVMYFTFFFEYIKPFGVNCKTLETDLSFHSTFFIISSEQRWIPKNYGRCIEECVQVIR